jgi:hypothetical protein
MAEFTKAERHELNELARTVHEAEAHRMLEALDADFHRWRTGGLSSSALLALIHQFHQQQSRDLWAIYRTLRAPDIVARGIAFGFIADDAVSASLRARLEPTVAFYRLAQDVDVMPQEDEMPDPEAPC